MARRASIRELAVVYLMAVTAFGYFVGTWQDGNTYSRLALVRAVAQEHRFEIDTSQLTDEWSDFRTIDRSFYNGHYYSDKAIGSSLIGAVVWVPARWLLRGAGVPVDVRWFKVTAPFFGVSLVCALLAPLIYAFVTSISGGRMALLVTSAIVFGTPVYRYSTGFYGHVQAGLFFLAAFLIWFRGRKRGRISYLQAFASCVLLGYMVVTEYPTAVLALVLGCYMLFVLLELGRLPDWRTYAAGAAGFLLGLSPLLYYNLRVFGNIFTTGYQHHATAKFAAAHSQGLSGIGMPDPMVMGAMTFHPLMGIFWQSPVLLLAVVGWMAMRRTQHRAELWFSLSAILAYVALISGYYNWSGGLSYTPRHLIPLMPLFAVPLAFLPLRWAGLGWSLAVLSIAQHMIAAAARLEYLVRLIERTLDANHHPTTVFVSTIWSQCWSNLRAGLYLKNRGTWLISGGGFPTLLPLVLVEAALVVVLVRAIAHRENAPYGPRAGGASAPA
jgi:hypothetical protein